MERNPLGFFFNQLTGAGAGAVGMLLFSQLHYRKWRALAWPVLLLAIGTLIVVVLPFTTVISPPQNGARRWLVLGPVRFQPSEAARFAVIIWAAMLAAKKGDLVRGFKKGVVPFMVILGLVGFLILLQPNLSMAVLVVLLGGVVLFTAGARIGHFLLLGVAALFGGVALIWSAPYRLQRLRCFLEPCAGGGDFQLDQALIGFGSGGPLGAGYGRGQLKLQYLYSGYSDFLAATIGEEWGFVGVLVIALLFFLFCWLGFRIAKTAPDPFGQYLATGITASIGIGALLHAAVNLGLMPTTGLTMPFMSYGRSQLVVSLVSVGVLINIGRMRGKPVPAVSGQR
jgi:cell division protein FtsW